MNTTKTLEGLIADFSAKSPHYTDPKIFAAIRDAYVLALDACRESVPKEWPSIFLDEQETRWKLGYDSCREETLSAIDSLRV